MEKPTTQELMNQLTERLILDLKENEVICPTCKGLRFVLIQRGDKTYIESCRDCYTGKVYVCKHCEATHMTNQCDCYGACEERYDEQEKFELERFNKAEKISFKDYEGYFLWGERAISKEDFEEELYCSLECGQEVPNYMYATTKEYVSIGVDIVDEITNNCSDGYEDMADYVDLDSKKLQQAQELVDEWVKEQGKNTAIYYEDYKRVVLLDDLIEELKAEIKRRKDE